MCDLFHINSFREPLKNHARIITFHMGLPTHALANSARTSAREAFVNVRDALKVEWEV